MSQQKKKGLSREEAGELYNDLKRAMATLHSKRAGQETGKRPQMRAPTPAGKKLDAANSQVAAEIAAAIRGRLGSEQASKHGQWTAIGLVMLFAATRVVLSAMDAAGLGSVRPAHASVQSAAAMRSTVGGFSKEELSILTALDNRRVEMEDRARRLDDREAEMEKRDRELVARMTQLKELTDSLRSNRETDDKKRSAQVEQLSNVYGSMNPPEAAALIEQLDITIALELLEKMPEKRIGQILSLMSPQRALQITKLLSGKVE